MRTPGRPAPAPRRPPALAGGLALLLAACAVRSPETEAREALLRLSRVEIADAGGARVDLGSVRFADVVVSMDGKRALVVAIVEATGRVRLDGAEPEVSYVGREAFAMERCAAERWCPVGTPLPALRGVVAALASGPREPGARPLSWQIRVERGKARVGEDRETSAGRTRALREVVLSGEVWRVEGEG